MNDSKTIQTDSRQTTSLDPQSPAEYRRVMGRIPTSVAIITAIQDGDPVGVAIGSFGSVSLDPPLAGFYIAASSTTWPLIAATGGFCANILGDHQEDLCRLFATRGADKFSTTSWSLSPAGRPLIDGCTAWIDCDLGDISAAGDHHHVVGKITGINESDVSPLVFLGGRYGQVAGLDGVDQNWD